VRIAYFDCSMGISGDMTLGALIDSGVDVEAIRAGIASLNLPEVKLLTETVIKGGFRATYVTVEHPEQHAHRHFSDIVELIDTADALSEGQKDLAKRIFEEVAVSEAKVHGSSIEKVHFHEVGAVDSIVDIVGAAIGFDLLGAEQIISSAVPTGRGQIHIDHGICTVPAPGTAELLKGIPLVDVPVEAELTTPTGAAILKTVVSRFGALPEMIVEEVGYGAGTKSFPSRANLLRLFVGTASVSPDTDRVVLLETNLDDVSGEVIGHAKQELLAANALDVYTTPIQMKKDRPGVILSVLCQPADEETLASILFAETNTFGIRRFVVERFKLARQEHTVETAWGTVKGKLGWRHGSREIFTPEFEDCARIAAEENIPLREVYRAAESGFNDCEMPVEQEKQEHSYDHDHDHDHDDDHDHG
jgi:uncharacterized protein (TIGR00299 family) protein